MSQILCERLEPLSLFPVTEVQEFPSDEVRMVPDSPTTTYNEDEVDVFSVVVSVELELVDDSSLSAQETTARHKHEIRIRKMKITFFIVYSIKNYKERVLKSNKFRFFNQ